MPVWWVDRFAAEPLPGCVTEAQNELTLAAPPAATSSLWNATAFCVAFPLVFALAQAVHRPKAEWPGRDDACGDAVWVG